MARIILTIVLSFIGIFITMRVQADNPPKAPSSILDRLEQRLLNDDASELTFDKAKRGNAKTRYEYEGDEIQASAPGNKELDDMERAITNLERDAEALAKDVQQNKQSFLAEIKLDNLINIDTKLSDQEGAGIRSLRVKIDGYLIYETPGIEGLWTTGPTIPLYSGPMKPGKHKVEYEARIVSRHSSKLPVDAEVYHQIDQTFDVEVPEGKQTRNWQIAIDVPKTSEGKVEAKLETR